LYLLIEQAINLLKLFLTLFKLPDKQKILLADLKYFVGKHE